jgi:hypothetical protein
MTPLDCRTIADLYLIAARASRPGRIPSWASATR